MVVLILLETGFGEFCLQWFWVDYFGQFYDGLGFCWVLSGCARLI